MPTSTRSGRSPARRTAPPAAVVDPDGAEILDAPVEVLVTFTRDGVEEKHTFAARPEFDYKNMADVARIQRKRVAGDASPVLVFERFIRPSLVDDDGTPARWEPEIARGEFVDLAGDTRPVADLAELQALEAGSSRRRWCTLMDDEDDLRITLEEIQRVYEELVEASAERPTRRS